MKKRSAQTLLFFILALPFTAISQNKPFTYDQLFRGAYPENIFQRLPNVLGWLDDKHYLQRNSSGVLESIDALSGKASKYNGVAPESNRPHTPPLNSSILLPPPMAGGSPIQKKTIIFTS